MNVDKLSDQDAVRVLALIVDHSGPVPDDQQLREIGERLRDAASDPELDGYSDQPPASAGDLARTALAHLAATPERADVVQRAIRIAADDRSSRLVEPGTLALLGLIAIALRTEFELTRSSTGRWRLRVHKPPVSDSTLGKLLTKLVGLARGSNR